MAKRAVIGQVSSKRAIGHALDNYPGRIPRMDTAVRLVRQFVTGDLSQYAYESLGTSYRELIDWWAEQQKKHIEESAAAKRKANPITGEDIVGAPDVSANKKRSQPADAGGGPGLTKRQKVAAGVGIGSALLYAFL